MISLEQWKPTTSSQSGFAASSGLPHAEVDPIYERGKVKRAGAEHGVESSRTSPSPSASVDLAHLRPHPRSRLVHSRHTSPEPEAEGEPPSTSSIHHEPLPA
jgi:hypothetical protein